MSSRRATAFDEPLSYTIVRRILATGLVVFLCFGAISANRAWTQVRSVGATVPRSLRGGEQLTARIVASGRTPVTLQVELVQEAHRAMLASKVVPNNHNPFFNFIFRHDSVIMAIPGSLLTTFSPGPAAVVVSGLGRSQWLRVPPPVVETHPVTIMR